HSIPPARALHPGPCRPRRDAGESSGDAHSLPERPGDTYKLLALGVFLGAVAPLILRTHALRCWLGWVAVVLARLLIIAGWNFVLSPSVQYAAYRVLLVVLLLWVVAVGVVSLRRAA